MASSYSYIIIVNCKNLSTFLIENQCSAMAQGKQPACTEEQRNTIYMHICMH